MHRFSSGASRHPPSAVLLPSMIHHRHHQHVSVDGHPLSSVQGSIDAVSMIRVQPESIGMPGAALRIGLTARRKVRLHCGARIREPDCCLFPEAAGFTASDQRPPSARRLLFACAASPTSQQQQLQRDRHGHAPSAVSQSRVARPANKSWPSPIAPLAVSLFQSVAPSLPPFCFPTARPITSPPPLPSLLRQAAAAATAASLAFLLRVLSRPLRESCPAIGRDKSLNHAAPQPSTVTPPVFPLPPSQGHSEQFVLQRRSLIDQSLNQINQTAQPTATHAASRSLQSHLLSANAARPHSVSTRAPNPAQLFKTCRRCHQPRLVPDLSSFRACSPQSQPRGPFMIPSLRSSLATRHSLPLAILRIS